MTALPLLPAPAREPRWCRYCGRPIPVGPVIGGAGSGCARKHGLTPPATPPRIPRPRQPRHGRQDWPDLLDLLADERHTLPMDATFPDWLTAAYPTARDWQPAGDNQWTASQPGPFGDHRLYVRADGARHIRYLVPADEHSADVDAHIWKKLGYDLEEAALPACVAPSCDSKGSMVFHAAEPGMLGGRQWNLGDEIRLCPAHGADVYQAQGGYGIDQLAGWLRPAAPPNRQDGPDLLDLLTDGRLTAV